ncbi:MAG TPA: SDR family oxidoreductase [Pirellulaceae bacterium]|nr:SDR family oxidoreductase [Pirellulaceae bacterium]
MSYQVVVTGGAGFIGSHIVDALVARGDQVTVIDNLATGKRENLEQVWRQIRFVEADICDEVAVADAMRGADFVIHQAALASVPLSVEQPLLVNRACVTGTLVVLEQARRAGVRRVIYAGSSACYGDSPFSAKRETDTPQTLSPYAVAKLAGEYYCQSYYLTHGLETVCLRYFNVFGPRQDPNSHYSAAIPRFITRMLAGQRPIVFGDGHQSRDFTYVGNVVHANLLALSEVKAAGQTFNIADGRATTVLSLLALLGQAISRDVHPEFQPARPGDIRDSLADISAAVKTLGYRPTVDLAQGLKRSIDYYRQLAGTV